MKPMMIPFFAAGIADEPARLKRRPAGAWRATVALLGGLAASASAQLFQQDFSSSTTLADYISATPNTGQWNAIGTSGAQVTVSAANNNLRFTRGTGNAGSFSRTTDFPGPPAALIVQFDLSVSGNSAAQTTAAIWQMGSGFGTANSAEANALVHSRFGLNLAATDGQFSLRNIGAGTNGALLSGTQTITWVINNSGATLTYLAPDATQETVPNDTADVWAGTTRVLDNVAATTGTVDLTDWKFVFSGGSATITMDNFLINTLSATPPQHLTITAAGDNAILTWTNSDWTLLAAPAVTGPYTNVPGAVSGYAVPLTEPAQFFRLTNSAAGP
jgi:hypothetical protein